MYESIMPFDKQMLMKKEALGKANLNLKRLKFKNECRVDCCDCVVLIRVHYTHFFS